MQVRAKKASHRVRFLLLALLWAWAILVFVIIDLFWNVEELDYIRSRSRVYAGMRRAAHVMVGEPVLEDDILAGKPAAPAAQRARGRAAVCDEPTRSSRTVHAVFRPGVGGYREHGTWPQWNDPGNEVGEGQYLDGQRHGLWVWYWPNGNRREAREYQNGRLDGTVESWYEDGSRQVEEHYVGGKPHGEWKSWHPDGTLASVGAYTDGMPNGPFRQWYANGRKAAEGEYAQGKRTGTWSFWDEQGNVTEERYEVGKKVS